MNDEVGVRDHHEMIGIHDEIARAMWEQYQRVVHEREVAGGEDLDIEDLLDFDED